MLLKNINPSLKSKLYITLQDYPNIVSERNDVEIIKTVQTYAKNINIFLTTFVFDNVSFAHANKHYFDKSITSVMTSIVEELAENLYTSDGTIQFPAGQVFIMFTESNKKSLGSYVNKVKLNSGKYTKAIILRSDFAINSFNEIFYLIRDYLADTLSSSELGMKVRLILNRITNMIKSTLFHEAVHLYDDLRYIFDNVYKIPIQQRIKNAEERIRKYIRSKQKTDPELSNQLSKEVDQWMGLAGDTIYMNDNAEYNAHFLTATYEFLSDLPKLDNPTRLFDSFETFKDYFITVYFDKTFMMLKDSNKRKIIKRLYDLYTLITQSKTFDLLS